MFVINAASCKSASSDSVSSLSSMSTRSDLHYVSTSRCPSPAATTITFGTADHVDPINLTKDFEPGEIPDEDKSVLIPEPFTMQRPAQVQIKIEQYSDSHYAREVESAAQTADDAPDVSDAASNVSRIVRAGGSPSHVRQQLDFLYRALHSVYGDQPPAAPAKKEPEVKCASDFNAGDDDTSEESWSAWMPASPAPPQGDSTHPPSQWVCGEHPGMGWELNDILTTSFYRFQIPDPTTNRIIVAPYISYSIQRDRAEVQGTYGKGYPILTHTLEPIRVDYYCPPMTSEQLTLFDAKAPYASAVNRVLNENFPLVLSAAVRRYQFYKEEQYAAQERIRRLQEKERNCLEKAMCVLSEMENANVIGRLFLYEDEILNALTHNQPAASLFLRAIHPFRGVIPTSALDSTPNPWRNKFPSRTIPANRTLYQRLQRCSSKERNHIEVENRAAEVLQESADEIEDRLRAQLEKRKPKHPLSAHKKCFRCGHMGHIRAHCYNFRSVKNSRK